MAELIVAVAEFTVSITVVVETLLDCRSEPAPYWAGADDWLLEGPCVVVSSVALEGARLDSINAGYESIPSRIRANAIPNPAVAIGLSGNLNVFLHHAVDHLIVLPFRTLVVP